jgi:gas vesicle protein
LNRHPAGRVFWRGQRDERSKLMKSTDLLVGAAIGAALALMLDPQSGRRRRALVRDRMVRASRKTRDGLDATARDLYHRTRGMAAVARGRLTERSIDDARLIERVRARLGRATSHPHAIDVEVEQGEVTLRGVILAREINNLLATVAVVRGVRNVINELEPHDSAESIPSLQGHGYAPGPSIDLLQKRWAPSTRALVATAGLAATGVLAAYARR